MKPKRLFRPGILLFALAGLLALHAGYLYFKVGSGMSRNAWEVPSVLYGRPTRIRPGDSLANLRFEERLRRLSYRKVTGAPREEGRWSEEGDRIRIRTRDFRYGELEDRAFTAEIEVREGRVASLTTPAGAPLEVLLLEPEEVGRIFGPGMESRRMVPFRPSRRRSRTPCSPRGRPLLFPHRHRPPGVARARSPTCAFPVRAGGSTITQQLAKNFFLTPEKSLWRKIREAELALLMEIRFSKKQILEAYLNKIYFGQEGGKGIYGVEEAARFYFSRSVGDLSLEEAALLAGIIRSPNRYSPLRMPRSAGERRNWVLSRMAQLGMIGDREYAEATRSPVRTNPRRLPARGGEYFADYIQRVAEDGIGDGKLYQAGTGSTPRWTRSTRLRRRPPSPRGSPRSAAGRKSRRALQAALVAVDPATGELTAMVGARIRRRSSTGPPTRSGSPAARSSRSCSWPRCSRPPGRKGSSRSPRRFPGAGLGPYACGNGRRPTSRKQYGAITVRRMIEESVNTATVRLATTVGLPQIVSAARDAGITSPLSPVPSMALGSFEVTPVEMAYAYATLASGGTRYQPFPLDSITGAKGESIYARKADAHQAFDPRAAYLVSYALQGVFDRGTARAARAAGILFPVSGKTGTTDEYRYSWFVGYTPEVVCAVWVGTDSGRDTGLSGAAGALRIWTRFMKALYPASGPRALAVPPGVVTAVIDPASGYLATSACPEQFTEAFIEGTAPKETCPLHPFHPLVDTFQKGMRGIGEFFRNIFK
jgi:penicillin-binding protein 1B